jgi:hypothetical protein
MWGYADRKIAALIRNSSIGRKASHIQNISILLGPDQQLGFTASVPGSFLTSPLNLPRLQMACIDMQIISIISAGQMITGVFDQ